MPLTREELEKIYSPGSWMTIVIILAAIIALAIFALAGNPTPIPDP